MGRLRAWLPRLSGLFRKERRERGIVGRLRLRHSGQPIPLERVPLWDSSVRIVPRWNNLALEIGMNGEKRFDTRRDFQA